MLKRRKLLTEVQRNKKVLYFAYGSNMHQPRLEQRVGQVTCLGAYTLKDYRLVFDTGSQFGSYANVKEESGQTCEGVVYEMTYVQMRVLDSYEQLYYRVQAKYKNRKLHIYISNHRCVQDPQFSTEYYALLMLGCLEHGLKQSMALVQTFRPSPRFIVWERLRIYVS